MNITHQNVSMLYKHPGQHEIQGDRFDYVTVPDDDIEIMLADGWHRTPTEALEASEAAKQVADRVAAEQAAAAQAAIDAQEQAAQKALDDEIARIKAEGDKLASDRAALDADRQALEAEREQLKADRDAFDKERAQLAADRAAVEAAKSPAAQQDQPTVAKTAKAKV